MKRILSIFFSASVWLLMPLAVFAGTVTTTQDFSITLPSNGEGYTVKGASSFNNLDVSGGAFTFTIAPQDQVIVISSLKRNLVNSRAETICGADDSRTVQDVATTVAQVSVTITPSGTCTVSTIVATGGGGGGGGGSGGTAIPTQSSSPSPSPSPTSGVTPQLHALIVTKPIVPPPAAVSIPPVIILRTIGIGSQGNDVATLQKFLASDKSIYPEGIVSGYFGPKTKTAIGRFQEKYGIVRNGQPGYGTLGPKTRAKLKELSSTPAPLPSSLPIPPSPGVRISDLQAQIKTLQDMLDKLKKK